MRRLTGNDEFVQFIKTKKYATVMQDKIYTYLSDLEILIKQYWPELLISRYVEDDADKKESLFECINLEQELSIDHLRLQILLSSYIEYLNKHEYQRLLLFQSRLQN